jgi:hypothetical protein
LFGEIPAGNTLYRYLPPLREVAEEGGRFAARSIAGNTGRAIAAAYAAGLQGCFCRSVDAPAWSRAIAEAALGRLRQAWGKDHWLVEQVMPAAVQGSGRGKRAINYAYTQRILPGAYRGSQQFSNCTAWMTRELTGTLVGMAVAAGDLKRMDARHGTALVYAYRGSAGDSGMNVGTACEVVTEVGQSEEKDYGSGLNLSTQDLDETAGVRWGRGGPPQALLEALKGDTIAKAWHFGQPSAELVMDVLWNEGVIATGSTLTGQGPGDPVCGLTSIGGHAQAALGYDDSDEFRAWYRQTTGKTLGEAVVIMDQSWGPDWITIRNWPEQLWGPRPEGSFVLPMSHFLRLLENWGEGYGLTGAKGFVARRLPDWGSFSYL